MRGLGLIESAFFCQPLATLVGGTVVVHQEVNGRIAVVGRLAEVDDDVFGGRVSERPSPNVYDRASYRGLVSSSAHSSSQTTLASSGVPGNSEMSRMFSGPARDGPGYSLCPASVSVISAAGGWWLLEAIDFEDRQKRRGRVELEVRFSRTCGASPHHNPDTQINLVL